MQSEVNNPLPFTTRLSENGDLAVLVTSIDNYLETAGLKKLDFVKIDVEREEEAVIRGMTRTMQVFRPAILVEIHFNGGAEMEALARLKATGCQLQRVERDRLSPCDAHAQGSYGLGLGRA